MKSNFRLVALSMAACGLLVLASCKGDDNNTPQIELSEEETIRSAQADGILEGAQHVVESGYNFIEDPNPSSFPIFGASCPAWNYTIVGNNVSLLIDFNPSCQLLNDVLVSGQILLEYGPLINGIRAIVYTYLDFSYEGHVLNGGGDMIWVSENANGNRESNLQSDVTIAFANSNVTAQRTGTRTSEWVAGANSGNWFDNIYHIWGSWTTTLNTGFQRVATVDESQYLVRNLGACPEIVAGIMIVNQDNISGELDFGDGTCDGLAIFTVNGVEFPITLN
jgi:hypothetical protein